MEDAGAVSGGGTGYRLGRIVLALVLPSYVMGALLIFITTISELGTPATLGRTIGFDDRENQYLPVQFLAAATMALVLGTFLALVGQPSKDIPGPRYGTGHHHGPGPDPFLELALDAASSLTPAAWWFWHTWYCSCPVPSNK